MAYHFFVTGFQQPNIIEHLGKKPSDVGATTEPENENICKINYRACRSDIVHTISLAVELHQEFVAAHHMLSKGAPDRGVASFLEPGVEACDEASVGVRVALDISSNT